MFFKDNDLHVPSTVLQECQKQCLKKNHKLILFRYGMAPGNDWLVGDLMSGN